MKRRILALCALLLTCICSSLRGHPAQAQAGVAAGVVFDQQLALPGSRDTKFPQVTLSAGEAHMAGNTGRLDASYWSRPADASGIGGPLRLGPALEQPDYSTASIAAGRDGRLYYAWINQPERAIYLRVRGADGAWGPAATVQRGSPFPVAVQVGVAADNSIFVLWRDPDRPFVYSRSTDGGARWSAPQPVSIGAGINTPALATGASGVVAVAYTQGEGDRLQVYAGLWDGARFQEQRISPLSDDFADPGVAVAPDGRILVAWRGIADSGRGSGVYLAERQADGAWAATQLLAGLTLGRVNVAFDEGGGAHLTWIGMAAGLSQLWHTYRPAGGVWSAPVAAPYAGGPIFNAHSAAGRTGAGQLYAHAVSELFFGSRVVGQAYRFAIGAPTAARPVLEGGATQTRAASLALSLVDRAGDPRELRYRWGGPPAAGDAWVPIVEPLSVAAPPGAGVERCADLTLYTQVRGASGVQEPAASVGITLDRGVQATVAAINPSGAPGYTAEPLATLQIDGGAECSQLSYRAEPASQLQRLSSPQHTLAVALHDVEGPHVIPIELTDGLGNSRWYRPTVVYDRTAPLVDGDPALAIEAEPQATVLHRLTLRGVRYSDAGAAHPWAAAIHVARAEIAADAPLLQWHALPLDPARINTAADGSLTVSLELSLAGLLPREALTAGRYYYLLRLIDPAGNRSAATIAGSIALEQISYPQVHLPLLAR